jgi:hypothetical protein
LHNDRFEIRLAPSREQVAVERAVLDGLEDVGGADGGGVFEIGGGAGDLEDEVVGQSSPRL